MSNRKEYARLWHLKNKERRNAAAREWHRRNPDPKNTRRARARAYLTDAQREVVRSRDRAYRATRKAQDAAYREKNREHRAKMAHEAYLRRKAAKKVRDPIAAAKRLATKAEQIAKQGYSGRLVA